MKFHPHIHFKGNRPAGYLPVDQPQKGLCCRNPNHTRSGVPGAVPRPYCACRISKDTPPGVSVPPQQKRCAGENQAATAARVYRPATPYTGRNSDVTLWRPFPVAMPRMRMLPCGAGNFRKRKGSTHAEIRLNTVLSSYDSGFTDVPEVRKQAGCVHTAKYCCIVASFKVIWKG
jgi:hypothetical protein